MNKYEIKLKDGSVVVVEGEKYFCDVDLISVVRDEVMVATFHNWESVQVKVEENIALVVPLKGKRK